MKKNLYANLHKEVKDILQKQQIIEDDYQNIVKDKITRQMRLINRDID